MLVRCSTVELQGDVRDGAASLGTHDQNLIRIRPCGLVGWAVTPVLIMVKQMNDIG